MQKQLADQATIVKDLLIGVYKIRRSHPSLDKERNIELFAGRLAASVRKIHLCDVARDHAASIAEAQMFQKEGDDLREQQIIRTAEINNYEFEYELHDELLIMRNGAAEKYAEFDDDTKKQATAFFKKRIEDQTPASIRQEFFDNRDKHTPEARKHVCTYYLKLFSDCDIALSGLKALLEAKADKEELAEVLGSAHTTLDLSHPRYQNHKDAKFDFEYAFDKDEPRRTTDPEVLKRRHYPRVRERLLLREELYDSKGEFDEFKLLTYTNEEFNSLLNRLRVQRDEWESYTREGKHLIAIHPKRLAVLATTTLKGNFGAIAEPVLAFLFTKVVTPALILIAAWFGIKVGENRQNQSSKPKEEIRATATPQVADPAKEGAQAEPPSTIAAPDFDR